jgi:hypothetical protein
MYCYHNGIQRIESAWAEGVSRVKEKIEEIHT